VITGSVLPQARPRAPSSPWQAEVDARKLLVHFLRDDLGVTCTHVGCDTTQCDACTILAVQADGAAVDTVEALSKADNGEHPLLSAFREHHALQCGFFTPGMIMSSLELLHREPLTGQMPGSLGFLGTQR
jgi:carbon-monoxide dehydrogenase small subunit